MADQSALLESLQKRLRLLEDKQELYELLDRYCKTPDVFDFEGHANCYTEDGTQNYGAWGPIKGREAIAKATREAEEDLQIVHHYMTNFHFDITGETATGTSSLLMVVGDDAKKPSDVIWHGGPYKWTFQRTAEGWKIQTMKLQSIWVNKIDSSGRWAIGGK